ncbi:MAG TPA: GNAT family N-acetyltransferase [Thermoanaerobaculia bacterium]|jgi:acyl-CoA synthetase (NDP forming)/GNAT superfamily N-acetyltransferase|nr:GNAT family N-acetyltransferase [Thermoanaerobaculia bacterium]
MFRIIGEPRDYSEYVLLRDGETVLLRTASRDDVAAVEALMGSVSREALQMRFMSAVTQVARSTVDFMCAAEPRDRLSLLVIVDQGVGARVVAIGTYFAVGVGGHAEVAFLVQDAYQGRGISTLILERLAGIAAGAGFTGFEAEVLYENTAMIRVFRDSGFEVHQAAQGGSLHVEFPVGGLAQVRERTELRDRIAAANSLAPLLRPRTVAVVGASRDPAAIGTLIFRAIVRGNFGGTVYPVNNQATSVHGVRACSSVHDLPEPAELAVLAVPARSVLAAAEEALRAGARGLLVVASGFAESGPEGEALQSELVTLVRSHGARLIGPNCLGLMNTHPDVRLNASLAPVLAPRGRIGFYSHSAALGLVTLDYAAERGLGFSTFVSAGNRADVSGNDLLQYWEEDPSTDIALLYLETFGNPRRFARVARRVSYRKPVLCVKGARSRAGGAVARAHVGTAAPSDANVETLFLQAGVIRADTLEEMFDVAVLLASQPLPRGNRVGITSNSGGVLTICADACDSHGLAVPQGAAVELGPLVPAEAYEHAVEETVARDDVDALIAIHACIGDCDPEVVGRAIRRGIRRAERESGVVKPALLCLIGGAAAVQAHRGDIRPSTDGDAAGPPGRRTFPSYRFPESAALALSRAVQYAAFRSRPAGRLKWFEDVDASAARKEVAVRLAEAAGGALVLEGDPARRLLETFRIPTRAAAAGGSRFRVEVRPDPSFGPLLRVEAPARPPVVRITPLTDNEVRQVVETAGLPALPAVEELLARVSQMIEELPWLAAMDAEFAASEDGASAVAVRLTFHAPAAALPRMTSDSVEIRR